MKKLKIGIFGVGRGMDFVRDFMMLNCEICAICDNHAERREKAAKELGNSVAVYDNFDEFIEHDLDAVILANFFHEHAPYAIKCLERGIHVFSECISNGTMAEGIELIRAAEKSDAIYMLAENYPHMKFNREIKRICDSKTLGKILYAEGEYNHPGPAGDVESMKKHNYFTGHWRNFLPRTYYITHSLGPVMYATGATPKIVSAHATFAPTLDENTPTASCVGDKVAIIMTKNDDGSVFRVTGHASFGAREESYRVCGTNGQIENIRGMGNKVMLRYNPWSLPEGAHETSLYEPEWNDPDEKFIMPSGHGGGDYLTARMFVECIREGKQPEHPFSVHSAVAMSSVAILAHRSVLEGGKAYEIPDFREEKWVKEYENDRLTPFLGENGEAASLPCCSVTDFAPMESQIEKYKELIK